MIITVDVRIVPTATCVMDGRSSSTILHIIRQLSVRVKIVRRDHVLVIILRRKKGALKVASLAMRFAMSQEIA